jgi:hypothetical protein
MGLAYIDYRKRISLMDLLRSEGSYIRMVVRMRACELELSESLERILSKSIYRSHALILAAYHIVLPDIHTLISISLLLMVHAAHFTEELSCLGRDTNA